jgi:hypothetical protein
MIDKSSEKVGRIVDAKLCAVSGGHKNVIGDDSSTVKRLEKQLEEARTAQTNARRNLILPAFREEMDQFNSVYGAKPTQVLMNCFDLGYITDAYNAEMQELTKKDGITRKWVSEYGEDEDRKIDGIKVKKGCDQKRGEIRVYSFE